MTDNPFQASSVVNRSDAVGINASNRALWIAYLVSPAVAPVSFIVILFLLGGIFTAFKMDVNPASFLVLPVVALTVGMVVCYLVAGIIGMPIAFYLRRRNALTGRSIHGAALGWSIFVSVILGVPVAVAAGARWYHVPLAVGTLACLITPPVLLSATSFWFLLRRNGGLSHATSR